MTLYFKGYYDIAFREKNNHISILSIVLFEIAYLPSDCSSYHNLMKYMCFSIYEKLCLWACINLDILVFLYPLLTIIKLKEHFMSQVFKVIQHFLYALTNRNVLATLMVLFDHSMLILFFAYSINILYRSSFFSLQNSRGIPFFSLDIQRFLTKLKLNALKQCL